MKRKEAGCKMMSLLRTRAQGGDVIGPWTSGLEDEVPTCTGSSSTPLQMGQSRSSSTSPWNLVTSYPMAHYWSSLKPVTATNESREG
ncbi:uncharacterized [Tachysurus ichikawai]